MCEGFEELLRGDQQVCDALLDLMQLLLRLHQGHIVSVAILQDIRSGGVLTFCLLALPDRPDPDEAREPVSLATSVAMVLRERGGSARLMPESVACVRL